jgi:hypothetical protein
MHQFKTAASATSSTESCDNTAGKSPEYVFSRKSYIFGPGISFVRMLVNVPSIATRIVPAEIVSRTLWKLIAAGSFLTVDLGWEFDSWASFENECSIS